MAPIPRGPRQLPPELVADILDSFVESAPSHAARTPNLAAFARVSRDWHDAATPLLYRDIYLDSKTRQGILGAMEGNEALAPLVRKLTLSGGNLTAPDFARMQAVLERCDAVTSLAYHCFDEEFAEDLTFFISSTWPTLQYLRADQSQNLYNFLSRLPKLETLVARYIEFPEPSAWVASPPPTPPTSGRSSPASSYFSDDSHGSTGPARPTFRLKRFDSGTSPLSANFQLLTSSSQASLRSLDVPISSLISQDLSGFSSLETLTLTLAERYLPVPEPDRPRAHGARDEARCLRRVRRLLRGIKESQVPLRRLEVYEPAYSSTKAFDADVFESERMLEAVPPSVEVLDLATIAVRADYLARAFAHVDVNEDLRVKVYSNCLGVRELILPSTVARSAGSAIGPMLATLYQRNVSITWV
ncbi:hypothetical protein BMF94_3631 [Rhodotorula taiwanensis]|uniref:Uncharacterized protein n=1 Tax=Rhodotorula taiwanensis TaxID=741276 RepID=A0A2S5B954_9BASI|nr:hypothetical protein BMF94_3631 [Rhodotorula taiwanensis]